MASHKQPTKRRRYVLRGQPDNRHTIVAVVAVAVVGIGLLGNTHAATYATSAEAESGIVAGNASSGGGGPGASNNTVKFGGGSVGDPQPTGVAGAWKLKFGDDFNGNTLDLSKWVMCNPSFASSCNPWNSEQEKFNTALTGNQNVVVSNGQLHLVTTKQGNQVYSGMVATGPNKFNSNQPNYQSFQYTYGLYEGRVKFPKGNGFWPSMWMLADQDKYGAWPNSGEYDVVEIAGNDPTQGYYTAHWGGSGGSCGHPCGGGQSKIADSSAGYHTYALDWEPAGITWYVDGKQVAKVTDSGAVQTHPFYIIANFSVGGTWGPLNGAPDGSTPFPASMDIDYLRVWQH